MKGQEEFCTDSSHLTRVGERDPQGIYLGVGWACYSLAGRGTVQGESSYLDKHRP